MRQVLFTVLVYPLVDYFSFIQMGSNETSCPIIEKAMLAPLNIDTLKQKRSCREVFR